MTTISLTIPVSTLTLTDGRATTTASVTNGASVPARITVTALPDEANPAAASWTTVDRPLREIAAGATDQFTVTFAPPPATPPGTYAVRLLAYSADRPPEEYADLARRVEVVVPPLAAPPAPKRPWWPIAAIVAALVVVAAVVAFLVLPHNGDQGDNGSSATATSAASGQPATPTQVSPTDGSVFNIFPRTTTLTWTAVPGAASYTIEIDCKECCATGKWCTDVGRTFKVVPGLTSTTYTFDFVGAQPGRWRVSAVSASGTQSATSPWWMFTYTR